VKAGGTETMLRWLLRMLWRRALLSPQRYARNLLAPQEVKTYRPKEAPSWRFDWGGNSLIVSLEESST
jgi:hypothetical protein